MPRAAYGNSGNKWTDNAAMSDEERSAAAFKLARTNEQAECAADRMGAKEVGTPRFPERAHRPCRLGPVRVMKNDRQLAIRRMGSLLFN